MRHDATVGPTRKIWAGDETIEQELRETRLRDGLVVLPGLVPGETGGRHVAAVATLRATVPNGHDEHGLGDHIGQLHQKLSELIDTVSSPELVRFLAWALRDDPLLFASLNFDRSTQQESHVDLIYFCTEPLYAMAGVWVALEDIDLDAGPLFYHLGSYYWEFDYPAESIARAEAVAGHLLGEHANAWLNRLAGCIDLHSSEKRPMVVQGRCGRLARRACSWRYASQCGLNFRARASFTTSSAQAAASTRSRSSSRTRERRRLIGRAYSACRAPRFGSLSAASLFRHL